MKKYLINGAMALIVGGFIVSCSHDDISQPATVDQMTKSFDEMFTELYGPIAPNHNWGFATVGVSEEANDLTEDPMLTRANTRANTRAIDINGNQWDGPDIPLVDIGTEDIAIKNYVNYTLAEMDRVGHLYSTQAPTNLTDYFVTQVWTGTDVDKNRGNQDVKGSAHMNKLEIAMDANAKVNYLGELVGNWQHIYNFNAASNTNYNGNTRVVKGGCFDFAYHGTEDSRYHNRWIIVDGANIGYPGYYYVCFDFQQIKPDAYTVFYDANGQSYDVPGVWDSVAQAVEAGAHARGNYIRYDQDLQKNIYEEGKAVGSNWRMGHVVNGNMIVDGNGKYTDWIIRLVNAIPSNPNAYSKTISIQKKIHKKIIDQGRVFCEDIATAYRQVKEDIDYNDIVFDARVWEIYDQYEVKNNETTTPSAKTNWRYQYDICLLATGGTIAEKVGIDEKEVDVHDAFGVGQAFMVNTWTPNCPSTLSGQWNTPNHIINAVDFSYTIKKSEQNNPNKVGISTIPITVKYDGTNGGVKALNNRETTDGTDADGKAIKISTAPYKLCVPLGTPWPIERANIQSAYKNFSNYVSGEQAFWTDNIEQNNLYTSAPPSSIHNDKKAIGYTEDVNDGNATSSTVMVVWDKPVSERKTMRLYNFNFVDGQTLRFYGTGSFKVLDKNNQELFSVVFDGGSKDIKINNYQAGMLKESITITSSSTFSLTEIVALDKF